MSKTVEDYKAIVFNDAINVYDARHKLDRFSEPPRFNIQPGETWENYLLRLRNDQDLFRQSFENILTRLGEAWENDSWARWYGDFSVAGAVAYHIYETRESTKEN